MGHHIVRSFEVLFIEKDLAKVQYIANTLQAGANGNGGITLTHCWSTKDALQRASLKEPDVLLVEVNVDVPEQLQYITNLSKRLPDTPLVVIVVDEQFGACVIEAGAHDCIGGASITSKRLVQVLRHAILRFEKGKNQNQSELVHATELITELSRLIHDTVQEFEVPVNLLQRNVDRLVIHPTPEEEQRLELVRQQIENLDVLMKYLLVMANIENSTDLRYARRNSHKIMDEIRRTVQGPLLQSNRQSQK